LYTPEHFSETRGEVLRSLLARHPLGLLIAQTTAGLSAEHIPMQCTTRADGVQLLRGHVARANALWRALPADSPVLAVFTGARHYISPSWYLSKQESGKVVPTWNYATVHARGRIRFIEDAAWLASLVESLTNEQEAAREPRWHVADAPADYIAGMLRGIVGFEIELQGLEGKFKASQNRSAADRLGVAQGMRAQGLSAQDIAELCREPASA
jgi:transcriptional regulator